MLRKLYPKLPVIMFSTLTERGAAATLDALSLGAADYATKPSNTGSPEVAIERIRTELIPKIKALCGAVVAQKLVPIPACRARCQAAGANQSSHRNSRHRDFDRGTECFGGGLAGNSR